MSDQRLKIAVFIDFDNVEIGVKTTLNLQFDIGAVLEAIKERGEVITKVAYGDWKRSGEHGRAMAQHAVRMVQRVMTPGGDKNGADINLALDALEMAFTHSHINAFVIVGGDSDFITLVEKLKQYDKKVIVVGGRAFTSVILQKNCHEFIAYENLVGSPAPRRQAGARTRAPGQTPVSEAWPLVKRALKLLADREVTPQLGLLKSTLVQLDSTFSERDYGAGTFRDFAERLAKEKLVNLRHAGRSILVDLPEADRVDDGAGQDARSDDEPASSAQAGPAESEIEGVAQEGESRPGPSRRPFEAVRFVQEVFQEGSRRWPLYIRQFKQALRQKDQSFDEQQFGFRSIVDLLRECQREGLLRLERDRKGIMRIFPGAELNRPAPAPVEIEEPSVVVEAEPEVADAEIVGEDPMEGPPATTIPDAEFAASELSAEPTAADSSGREEASPASRPRRRRTASGGTRRTRARSTRAPRAPRGSKTQ